MSHQEPAQIPPLAPPGRPVLPRVVDWIILKVTQLCNLDCTYCYIYHRGDDSWRTRPEFVSEAVASALAGRIAEHGLKHGLRTLAVEFHGGEPLLLGPGRMQTLVDILRDGSRPVDLRLHLQTN